jgi:hypothetical protein
MAFATVNVTPSMGKWNIVDGYATDISASSALLADIANNTYLVKSISIDMEDNDKWVKVFDDAACVLGPVVTKGRQWKQVYESPLVVKGALNFQTENDEIVHVTVCYRKFPTS